MKFKIKWKTLIMSAAFVIFTCLNPGENNSSAQAQQTSGEQSNTTTADPLLAAYMKKVDAALAEPFKGITSDGQVREKLYRLEPTGVSTARTRQAAADLLRSLNAEQRRKSRFPIDDQEWRIWSNIHRFKRQGVSLAEMTAEQKRLAMNLLRSSLSPQGFEKAVSIMKLNRTLGELTGKTDIYNEDVYWFDFFGEPSATEPWGWQIDGHHLIINYFVVGDQIVMSPVFMGSEPVSADSGKHKGTRVFAPEESKGLALIRSLSAAQQRKARIADRISGGDVFASAFRDNLILPYQGIAYPDLTDKQQRQLLALIEEYIGNVGNGHKQARMNEVRRHLPETRFAWMGGSADDSVFYYRVQSPVIIIEFAHQSGTAIGDKEPSRNQIHTVVRTPNGNDYGKELLRQFQATR